jgi:hypothetical protein
MAFPTVTETGGTSASNTSHVLTLPSFAVGDLIIIHGSCPNAGSNTFSASTSGWTSLWNITCYGNSVKSRCFYRKMQDGDGSTFTFTLTSAKAIDYSIMVIPAETWHGTSAPEAASAWSGTSSAASTFDCPALNPSGWDAEDTLWLTTCGNYYTNRTLTVPSGWTAFTQHTSIISGKRTENAASVDPGTFGSSSSTYWVVGIIAVRPAPDFQPRGTAVGFGSTAIA